MAVSKTTTVQSLIFDKDEFSKAKAKAWAKREGFSYGKVDIKKNTLRLRQLPPGCFAGKSFRTIDLAWGVQATIGKLKKKYCK